METSLLELIGKKFKRNKYGLSLWTDEITYVGHKLEILSFDKKTGMSNRKIEIIIKGSSNQTYSLDEIVIIDLPIHWIEKSRLMKENRNDSEIADMPVVGLEQLKELNEKIAQLKKR